MSSGSHGSILDLPFAARQRIVVVEDSLAERVVEELRRTPELPEESENADGEKGSRVARIKDRLRPKVDNAVAQLVRAAIQLRQQGRDIRIISDAQTEELAFPPGHPSRRVLYVAHPVIRNQYYPAATFHRLVVEHKFAEAMDLLMELGAETLTITQLRGYNEEDLLDILAAIPTIKSFAKSRKQSEGQSGVSFKAVLEPKGPPRIPEDCSWLRHEPLWMKLAENRMDGRLLKFSLAVRHLDSMSVEKSLEGEIKKFGLRVGGAFKGFEEVVWQLSGVFPPIETPEKLTSIDEG